MNQILPQITDLSLAKVRLIARLKGDGCVYRSGKRKTNYWLKYEGKDHQEINRFASDLRIVYGIEPKFTLHRSGKKPENLLPVVFIRSKQAYEDIIEYGPFDSRNWNVPDDIFNDKGRKIEFLRTFAEDEGSVCVDSIRIYSINLIGLKKLAKMLDDLGIENRINAGYGAARNVYGINIRKMKAIASFSKMIGFLSDYKKRKLDLFLTAKNLINKD